MRRSLGGRKDCWTFSSDCEDLWNRKTAVSNSQPLRWAVQSPIPHFYLSCRLILFNNQIQEVKRPLRKRRMMGCKDVYGHHIFKNCSYWQNSLLARVPVPLHCSRLRWHLLAPCTFTDNLEEDHRVTLMLKLQSLIVLSLSGETMNEVWNGNQENFRQTHFLQVTCLSPTTAFSKVTATPPWPSKRPPWLHRHSTRCTGLHTHTETPWHFC